MRRSGEIGGSSGGVAGGGSLGAGRLNYAALGSRRSSRNNNNNSCSSGNSYIEPGTDLTKRPLVVSFRRRSARTSSSSLDVIPPSPEKRGRLDYDHQELIKLHELSLSGSTEVLSLQLGLNSSKEMLSCRQELGLSNCKDIMKIHELTVPARYVPSRNSLSHIKSPPSPPLKNCAPCSVTTIVTTPTDKILRVEDIEIFQESQLKIERSGRKTMNKQQDSSVPSEACDDWQSNSSICVDSMAESRTDDSVNQSNHIVRKSFTLPCLTLR